MSPLVNDRKPFVKDRLADYVDVKERIRLFYERWPDGRLVTYEVRLSSDPDDVPRVHVWAKAYRTVDDPLPADGWSWMVLPGSTPYTRGSELENTETSAWGRAIGALGIGIERSIASADEVAAKEGELERPAPPPRARREPEPRPVMERSDEPETVTLTGLVAAGKSSPSDMLLRTGPDGSIFGFVLVNEETHGRTQVVAQGALADDIWDALSHDAGALFGKQVTVEGLMERVPWQKDGKDMPPFKRLALDVLRTPDWTLPDAPPVEAESIPLFEEPVA